MTQQLNDKELHVHQNVLYCLAMQMTKCNIVGVLLNFKTLLLASCITQDINLVQSYLWSRP